MRKVVVLNHMTLDGFFAGPNGEFNWAVNDPEVDKATHEMIHADTLLLGRVTYKHLEDFWPQVDENSNFPPSVKEMAKEVNGMTKLVFSTTRKDFPWKNSQLVEGDLINTVKTLKQGSGADILILGSGTLIQRLANEALIDEYVIIITPLVLGTGKPMFKDVETFKLVPVETRNFASGNIVVHYKRMGDDIK